eukprot:9307564-Karenia_brevis.AAC.1
MRAALQEDAVPSPGRPNHYWLLYVPKSLLSDSTSKGVAVECDLCRKCVAALKKRAKGAPCPEVPYMARARGLWG